MLFLVFACTDDAPKESGWPPASEETGAPDPGPEGHDYTRYSGEARFQSGYDQTPDARACDLRWETEGTPRELCEDCLWTFDVQFTFDEAASIQTIDCFQDLDATDWSWGLGLSLDWYGYGVPVVWYYVDSYDYWYPMFLAGWSYPDVRWGLGYLEETSLEAGETMYYTHYWYGSATVE